MKAFPNNEPIYGNDIVGVKQSTGMDLRDYFAAKAMQALVKVVQDCITSPEEVSKLSYKYADAMMKARNNEHTVQN